MTQENEKILLKDLCMRLPYGVKYMDILNPNEQPSILQSIDECELVMASDGFSLEIENVKPFLFPLSSMTEEQEQELITITNGKFRYMWGVITNAIPRKNTSEWGVSENAFIDGIEVINILYIWLLKNHFDINGLIPMGLANDATGLNIY